MRHSQIRTVLILSALLLLGSSADAQKYVYGGLGLSVPTGDFGGNAKTGWLATAGLGKDIGTAGAWVEGELMLGGNHHDVGGGRTNLTIVMAALGYTFSPAKKLTPYVLGAVGFLAARFRPETGSGDTEVKLAASPGAGLSYLVGKKTQLYLEARYIISSANLIPILAGVSINFGK